MSDSTNTANEPNESLSLKRLNDEDQPTKRLKTQHSTDLNSTDLKQICLSRDDQDDLDQADLYRTYLNRLGQTKTDLNQNLIRAAHNETIKPTRSNEELHSNEQADGTPNVNNGLSGDLNAIKLNAEAQTPPAESEQVIESLNEFREKQIELIKTKNKDIIHNGRSQMEIIRLMNFINLTNLI